MYYKNTLDQIRAELEYRKEFAGRARAALEGVTIEKTKSGKEFENLSRGLKGAKKIQEYGFDRIIVYFSTSKKCMKATQLTFMDTLTSYPRTIRAGLIM